MHGKTHRVLRILSLVLCISLLIGGVLTVCVGVYIEGNFEKTVPTELLTLSSVGRAPSFFVYEFEDRTNRRGEAKEIEVGGFLERTGEFLRATDVPKQLSDAFVAIEDKRFYKHRGVDWRRTVSAALNYVFGFSNQFGGSSITQQVIKNMTGRSEVTLGRKLQEILYALDLERRLDKSQIMELYLNVIHFSDQCDGIVAAAKHYFSKSPEELTLAECASLAAIVNSPSYYNPIRNPQNNLQRRNLILTQMYEQGMIDQAHCVAAINEPLGLSVSQKSGEDGVNSWYIDMVIEDVVADLVTTYGMSRSAASRLFYSGGLRIDVAMDEEIQTMAEEYYRTAIRVPTNKDGVRAQSAVIILDNRTGDILGVVGAVGKKSDNRVQSFATQTKRPPGSTIKPITVYGPALEKGLINWASVYDDVPVSFGKDQKTAWPRNANGVYRGLTTVSYAVAHSTNTVAVRILEELGLQNAFRIAKEGFHLESLISDERGNDCDVAALALGQLNYGVTLRELTGAYTVFADGGVYHPYRSYYRVLDADGNILLSNPDASEPVLSRETAAIMTKLLEGVVKDGTSGAVTLSRLCECAGKTGTTNKDGDRWFIGYTPDLLCGVWCGYEYPEPLEGRNLSTAVWNDLMTEIIKKKETHTVFDVPSTLIELSYCKDSGALMSEACTKDPRGERMENGWFVKGREPNTFCECHVLCEYDSEGGGVSHGDCPKDSIEDVALIRVERHFPINVNVKDAQYVYRGDPYLLEVNPNGEEAYFAPQLTDNCGNSATVAPFNASCTLHTKEGMQTEEEETDGEEMPEE